MIKIKIHFHTLKPDVDFTETVRQTLDNSVYKKKTITLVRKQSHPFFILLLATSNKDWH